MRIKFVLPIASLLTLGLISCASTTIYPGENNNFSLVTTSSDQGFAEKDALKKATDYCAKRNQSLVVLNHKTEYHGPDKTNAAMIGLASALLTQNSNPAKSNQDYEVTMNFKCK